MLEQFNDVGFVRIEGAFSGDEAAAIREVIWRALDDIHGIREDDPTTWTIERVTKLQPIKSDPVFALIGGARTRAAIDVLLVEWDVPRQWGGFLVSFPRHGATWTVPSREWHPDYHFYYPPTPLFGLGVFSYITDVAPGGGATVCVSRSYALIDRFVGGRSPEELRDFAGMKQAFHRTHPWLQELTEGDGTNDRRARFMHVDHRIDGVDVRVVELTGNAGDVVLMHPWLLHSFAPNCGSAPRFMRVRSLYRRDLG